MKVLVVGGGAREHAMLWKLAQSPRRPELFAAPGNAGTSAIATNLPVPAAAVDGLLRAVQDKGVDLTIVGPEAALAAGIVDRFQARGLAIFGPTQAAARLESSKAFAKEVMATAGVPTAASRTFDTYAEAAGYVQLHGAPVVIKADGLAAGKGVVVAESTDEALHALDASMRRRAFGAAGERVVVEECLRGQELSVFCFTDGSSVSTLVAACDYKRIHDGDRGPNTGGMGGYSPPPPWTPEMERRVREEIMLPVVGAMAGAGVPLSGVLYGGLILTERGLMVLEFNVRFGDPEAQVVLPRLETDLLDIIEAVLAGELDSLRLQWSPEACVGVVMASGGYPGPYETSVPITLPGRLPPDTLLFQAGTASEGDRVVTGGGRVMTAVGLGASMTEARERAYAAAATVQFQGAHYRRDIAAFGDSSA